MSATSAALRGIPLIALQLATAGGIAVGCSSSGAPSTETWTGKPNPTAVSASKDAGAAASSASDSSTASVDPPETLCTLNGPPVLQSGDALVWGDEFEGPSVDLTKWVLGSGKLGPANVLNTLAPSNVTLSGGSLFINTERAPSDPTYPYVSGYMQSLGRYARTYGKIEFRARFPYAAGVWYALWGRPWFDAFPEIDIELLNQVTVGHSQLYFVNHWGNPLPTDPQRIYALVEQIDFSQFHTYTVTWKPGLVEWAIDGVRKLASTEQGVPTKPVYWIINGWVGGWAQTPPDSTPFPNSFEVDYLRVYRVDGLMADPEIKIANPAPKYTGADSIQIALANFDEVCTHVDVYEGETRVWSTSTMPLHFNLARLSAGDHQLTFVATDGVRRATTTLDVQLD
jgi:beta-glucanase (GH16 family)